MKALIAEIGCMHLGELDKAFELIAAAKDCGATHVKMQAILPRKPIGGSMDSGFYELCSMSIDDYAECIDYGDSIGIPVFFSIFDGIFEDLFNQYPNMIRKISASQKFSVKHDNDKTIISTNNMALFVDHKINNMHVLHATPYNYKEKHIYNIKVLSDGLGRSVGLSDHSIGIDNCKQAITEYGSKIIEKHFYLGNDIKFKGQLYRDCQHSANPKEFTELAKFFEENTK